MLEGMEKMCTLEKGSSWGLGKVKNNSLKTKTKHSTIQTHKLKKACGTHP
jgi:hypothetical protein